MRRDENLSSKTTATTWDGYGGRRPGIGRTRMGMTQVGRGGAAREHSEAKGVRALPSVKLRLAAAMVATLTVGGLGSYAHADLASPPPPISVLSAEPAPPGDASSVLVERIAPEEKGGIQKWRLNEDIIVRNNGGVDAQLIAVNVTYPGSGVQMISVDLFNTIAPKATLELEVPEDRLLPYPLPGSVRVDMFFKNYKTPVTVTRKLADLPNEAATGSYRLPFDKADLPSGVYVAVNQDHDAGDNHRSSDTQRFAFDLGLRRWTGSRWTSLEAGGVSTNNSDYLVFGVPVRAMADGVIVGCERSVKENPEPGVSGSGGGNMFWIRHGANEYALYAHLQEGSVPQALCPKGGLDATGNYNAEPVAVKSGDILGRAGNTGSSSGPHTHIHLQTADSKFLGGAPANPQGIPFRFSGYDTHVKTASSNPAKSSWHVVTAANPASFNDAFLDPRP